MQILEPITRFSLERGIRSFEWLQAALLLLWSAVIFDSYLDDASTVGLYGRMIAFAPWWVWVAWCLGTVALIVAGAVLRDPRPLIVSIFGKLVFWSTVGVLTYQVASSFLVPSMMFAFALAAALRYGELRYEARGDG
jgi:hypothetical protein